MKKLFEYRPLPNNWLDEIHESKFTEFGLFTIDPDPENAWKYFPTLDDMPLTEDGDPVTRDKGVDLCNDLYAVKVWSTVSDSGVIEDIIARHKILDVTAFDYPDYEASQLASASWNLKSGIAADVIDSVELDIRDHGLVFEDCELTEDGRLEILTRHVTYFDGGRNSKTHVRKFIVIRSDLVGFTEDERDDFINLHLQMIVGR